MKKNLLVLAALVALASGCGEGPPPAKTMPTTTAGKVVFVDFDSVKPEASLEVARARAALVDASRICKLSDVDVADMAAATKNIVRDQGYAVSIVEVVEVMTQALDEVKRIEDVGGCAKVLAWYASTRKLGQSHMAATNGIRVIIRTLVK